MLSVSQRSQCYTILHGASPHASPAQIENALDAMDRAMVVRTPSPVLPAPRPYRAPRPVYSNPVIKRTALRAYPGYTVRAYRDGMFDCVHTSGALSLGHTTFQAAVRFARTNGTVG